MIKKKTLLRGVANTLPVVRAVAAPVIAEKIRTTKPEDRTWKLAAAVALIAVTDFIDGKIARKIGPTKLGGWLDQTADKLFILPSLKALGDTGEISKNHFYIKVARDVGMTATRAVAEHYGHNTDAQKLGKYKAATEMATQLVAVSPLSQRPALTEGLATAATTLSIVSAVQYGVSYMRQQPQTQPNPAVPALV